MAHAHMHTEQTCAKGLRAPRGHPSASARGQLHSQLEPQSQTELRGPGLTSETAGSLCLLSHGLLPVAIFGKITASGR